MAEYKHRLRNWTLLRDIMSGNTSQNIILAERVINQALEKVTKWPYSPAVTQTINSCKNTISQDGFELNFILSAYDMAPEFRERISIQYENFLVALDEILDEMRETIVKQHKI
jgi:SpoVK/Ycf46/Vps4 family AAA+-type ATPase